MAEFRINHVVSRLLSLLGTQDGAGREVYVDILTRTLTPYVTTQVSTHQAKRKIAEFSSEHEKFLTKYDELKSKQIRELDPLVYLLSKIIPDESILKMLRSKSEELVAKETEGEFLGEISKEAANLIPRGVSITQKELDKLRGQLAEFASSSEAEKRKVEQEKTRRRLRDARDRGYRIPDEPEWRSHRQHQSADFVVHPEGTHESVVSVGSLPLKVQERILIEDLLYVMTGVEGKYILVQQLKNKFSARKFVVDESLDSSLSVLVKRVLPLCSHYSFICRFIEEWSCFERGSVSHALCSAIRIVLKEYLILVAQLEHQNRLEELSLQKMWFHLQPTIKTFDIMYSISVGVVKGDCRGGQLLSLLHNVTAGYVGDPTAQEFCLFLTQKACVPYFEILEQWIYQGVIRDPYGEFLVEEHRDVRKDRLRERYHDAYWEKRYTVCRDRIPIFLEKVTNKILRTGKYLNVTRECDRDVHCPGAKEIVYTLKERPYVDQIEEAYAFASAQLLNLLMKEKDLMGRLRSVKHYFLLDQGDFFVQFLDLAEVELTKPILEISRSKLEALLELALRTSVAGNDPYIDDLKIELIHCDLITQLTQIMTVLELRGEELGRSFSVAGSAGKPLTGFQSLCFDYVVQWPVSLIINRKALVKYQFLFRFLFLTKQVERELNNVWFSAKTLRFRAQSVAEWQSAALTLRQRMLNFAHNFEYFVMVEVIEPSWQMLESALQQVTTVDDVLDAHFDFLDNCLRDSMLTNPDLLQTVHKLLDVCLTFSGFMKRLSDDYFSDETEDIPGTLANVERNFTQHVLSLLRKLQLAPKDGSHQMANLASRLDYNGFYNAKMDRQAFVTVVHKAKSGLSVPTSSSAASSLSAAMQSVSRSQTFSTETTDANQPSAFQRVPIKVRQQPPKPNQSQ